MASDEDSSESDTTDDKRMSDVYFSQKNENGEVGEPEVDMVDQRHPSINVSPKLELLI